MNKRIGYLLVFILVEAVMFLKPVFADQQRNLRLDSATIMNIEVSSSTDMCTETRAIEYLAKTVSNLAIKMGSPSFTGSVTWKVRLMDGNWSWSNGVHGVWGESELYIKGSQQDHSFGFNCGHDGQFASNSRWSAAKGTMDTHLMYVFIMMHDLFYISPRLGQLFSSLPDAECSIIQSKVRNQMIIAASHSSDKTLQIYLHGSGNLFLKAVAASGLAMQGNTAANQYLDKGLFNELSMEEYQDAAVAYLKEDHSTHSQGPISSSDGLNHNAQNESILTSTSDKQIQTTKNEEESKKVSPNNGGQKISINKWGKSYSGMFSRETLDTIYIFVGTTELGFSKTNADTIFRF